MLLTRKLRELRFGLATLIAPEFMNRRRAGTGGTVSARYCYSVWLRHLVKIHECGLEKFPSIVAELGPGDSIGIGLAAVISGADRYYGFDVVEHANNEKNLEVFDELIDLFKKRAPIPDNKEFPNIHPELDAYGFPSDILSEDMLSVSLEDQRIQRLRLAVTQTDSPTSPVRYVVPWIDASVSEPGSVDMIFSQAVLEHVDELSDSYRAMRDWLHPDGFMSHEIDFRCHGTADEWNGHWAYSDFLWKLIRGKRTWFLNRLPHSSHIALLKETGFDVICDDVQIASSNITLPEVAKSLQYMQPDDLNVCTAFIVSVPSDDCAH